MSYREFTGQLDGETASGSFAPFTGELDVVDRGPIAQDDDPLSRPLAPQASMPNAQPTATVTRPGRTRITDTLDTPDDGKPRAFDPVAAERLSNRKVAERPDKILDASAELNTAVKRAGFDSIGDMETANADTARRKKFARENKMLGGVASGAAQTLAGTINAPGAAAGFFNKTFVDPLLQLAGQAPMPDVPKAIGTEWTQRAGGDFMPAVAKVSPGQAWDNNVFGQWLAVNVAAQWPNVAQSVYGVANPGAVPAILPVMGATAAGQSFADGDDPRVAIAKGVVEVLSEGVSFGVAGKVKDAIEAMTPSVRQSLMKNLAARSAAVGGALTAQMLAGALEESAAQIGGNALDIYASGKNKGLTDDVDRAAVIGAAANALMASPNIVGAARDNSASAQAARALRDQLDGDFGSIEPEGVHLAELNPNLRAEPARPTPKPDPIVTIQTAPTVDAAIDAAETAVTEDLTSHSKAASAVDAIGKILNLESQDASVLPEIPGVPGTPPGGGGIVADAMLGAGVGTDGVAGPALDAGGVRVEPESQPVPLGAGGPAAVGGPAFRQDGPIRQVTVSPSGTVTAIGDPQGITKLLKAAGVTNILPAKNGVVVGASQAEQARKVLADFVPAQDNAPAGPVESATDTSKQAPSPAIAPAPSASNNAGKADTPGRQGKPVEAAPVTVLQAAYDEAKAKLDALGEEPRKPNPEARFFGKQGRAGAAPKLVAKYDADVKAHAAWKRKYSVLKKAEVEASNALFRAKNQQPQKVEAASTFLPSKAPQAQPAADVESAAPVVATPAKVAQYGRDGDDLAAGGKPFKTKDGAQKFRKKHRPQSRVVKVEGGFALRDKTDAEIKAGEEAGKRRMNGARRASYEKNPFLTFLAERGLYHEKGKPRSQKVEFSPDRQIAVPGYNIALFRRGGVLPDALLQPAIESGYLPPGASESQIEDLIRKAVSGQRVAPLYAEGGVEQEMERRMEAQPEEDADWMGSLDDADLEAEGFDRTDEEMQARVRELTAELAAAGVDYESILEEVAKIDQNEKAYYESAVKALEAALPRAGEAGARDDGPAAGARGDEAPAAEEPKADFRSQSVEQPAGRYNNAQLDIFNQQIELFLDSKPVASQAGPGIEEARRAAADALRVLRRDSTLLGQALASGLAERQRADLLGQVVTSPADLATLAQVYRDPRFETFRAFFVDGDGKIVSQVGLTNRLPGATAVLIGNDIPSYLFKLFVAAKQTGAKGYYLLHNHPSGNATPSRPDEDVTERFAKLSLAMPFRGHVVIDTNQYAVIDANGRSEMFYKNFGAAQPITGATEWANTAIDSPLALMDIAKKMAVTDDVTLVVMSNQQVVKNITSIPAAAIGTERARIVAAVRRAVLGGAGGRVAAVSRNEMALHRISRANLLLDAVHVRPDGSVLSFAERGILGSMDGLTPKNRKTRVTADTSPAFAYLREDAQTEASAKLAVREQDRLFGDDAEGDLFAQAAGEGLTAPNEQDILAQQDRRDNADALDEKARIDREAAGQTLTAQTAPEQRNDTTGDIFGGPTVEDALADKARKDAKAAKPPAGPSLFDAADSPAVQAAAILDAAAEPPKGKDRLDVLKDVKSGAVTPEEVAAAFPAKQPPAVPADFSKGVPAGTVLYHGTRGKLDATSDRPLFLTDNKEDARAYSNGMIPGTGMGQKGKPVTIAFTVTDDARVLDANSRINDAVMGESEEEADAAIEGAIDQAKSEGYDFVWFWHPSVTGEEMQVLIAVSPKDSLVEGVGGPPADKPSKIDDFGEKLPPARRAMSAKLSEELSDDAIASKPLSEIWPLAENEAIEDTFAAAVAHAARAEIPAKPRVAYKVKRWVESVKILRNISAHVLSGRLTRERLATEAGAWRLKDWAAKVTLLEQIPREQWRRIGAVQERPDAFTYADGKQVPMPSLRMEIDDKPHYLRNDGTVAGNLEEIRALLGDAAPEKRMEFEVRQPRAGGKLFVNKKGDSQQRRLMEFDTVAQARAAIKDDYASLVAAWEAVKGRDNITERDLRSAENRPRAGKDWRDGKDVTPEQFQNTFGFRGGEFGRWVAQGKGDKERQALLNSAYDALMDLSAIVGIPPKAVSLNGTLGIAFGSRGAGWASAHFEPSNLVINLTKTRGAGALAHEWFHALDNYFSRMRRGGEDAKFNGSQADYTSNNFITHQPEALMVRKDQNRGRFPPMTRGKLEAMHEARKHLTDAYDPQFWQRDPSAPEGVRPEVERRFADLVAALNDSPMTKRAILLDGRKSGGGYWSSTLERAARTFENYVQARMMEDGYHNDFLANVVPAEDTGRNPDRYPYLLPGEVKPIAEAFGALFDTIQTKETDAGVMLYDIPRQESAETIAPAPGFWSKIKAGESFTPEEIADAYASGTRANAPRSFAGMAGKGDRQAVVPGTEHAGWRGEVAGFEDYVTVGVDFADGSLAMGVIPAELYAGYRASRTLGLQDYSVVTYGFEPRPDGGFQLAIEEPRKDSPAFDELQRRGWLDDTPHADANGIPYFRVPIGYDLNRAFMQEAVRRLALHIGAVPTITFPRRETGARGRIENQEERSWSPDKVEAKFDISTVLTRLSYQGYEKASVPRVQVTRKMNSIVAKLDAGKITEAGLELEVRALAARLATVSEVKQANRIIKERERGPDMVRERLLRARRQGDLDAETVEFGLWLLDKNPNLADDLGISVRQANERGSAGQYNPSARIITLFKVTTNTGTAVHEILHHSERMMPAEVQAGIAKAWSKAYAKAFKDATPEQRQALASMAEATAGSETAQRDVAKAFRDGVLDYDAHYQLVNPSEFWAVNATRILQGRHEAGSWIGKAKQWLTELMEKAKSIFGLKSDAAVLKGLQAVLDGDGTFVSKRMLSNAAVMGDRADARIPQTETPAFKAWFKGSKVVDTEGRPLVVYHGSGQDLSVIRSGAASGNSGNHGIYFTPDEFKASAYAGNTAGVTSERNEGGAVYPVYLSLQNPLVIERTRVAEPKTLIDKIRAKLGRARTEDTPTDVMASSMYVTADDIASLTAAGYDGIVNKAWGEIVAFHPEQIKSAIGNRGTFDPENPSILEDIPRRDLSDADASPELSPWRDETGRLQFAPGAWLYDKLGIAASPLLSKLQLKAASPELRRALRDMKLQVAKAQETSAAVAAEAMKLSEAERGMVSDLIERELAAGTVPPEHAVRLAAMINTTMGAQTDELVRLGMLSPDSAERWRDKYLPRFYKSKLGKQMGDAWADALQRVLGRQRVMAGIKGKHLRGRGLYESVPFDQIGAWEAQGWEVRDPEYAEYLENPELFEGQWTGDVQMWRDFSRQERDSMGEIRDAGFRFVMGYMQTQRDIALGRLFESLAGNPEISGRRETEEFSVHVPDGTVPGTGAKRYGKLAGRWVSKDTMSHLSQIEEAQSEAWQMYRKALGLWKEGKVVLNPVSHVNNMVSNLTMAHFAGVGYHRVDKYIAAAHDFATKAAGVTEAKEAGLFLGTMSDSELMNVLPEDLKALVKQQDSAATKIGRTAFNFMTFYLRRPMGWAYQAEDTFFRYLIYKDARARGLEPADAVDYAQKYIFAYDDLPKGARMIRDFGVPFFAYTYKAVPALLHTAMTHPLRMAAPAAVLWGINAAAYAIAAGDDDDDWQQKLKKYLTDADYRAKAREKEKLEREFLPEWNKGSTSLGTPKVIRLGADELTKLPLFIDTSRIVPGGDLFDMHPNGGGIPWIQPLTPNNPILTTYMAMFGNKDAFYGKDLTDSNDTSGEKAAKRADWLWNQASPAIAIGNYHWDRGMNALAQASGGEVKWIPEAARPYVPGGESTGIGRDGNPVQPGYAAMQTFGIKVRPIDLETSEAIGTSMKNKMVRDIDTEIRKLHRLNIKGAISDKVFDKEKARADEKKDRLNSGLTVDGDKKD